jgi:hypothetical protein
MPASGIIREEPGSARRDPRWARRLGGFDRRVTSTPNYDMRLRPTVMRLSLFGIIALLVAGCGGGGGSTCGQTTDITGTWSGPVLEDDVARGNPGTVNASISQSGCDLGGEWFFVFQSPTLNKSFLIGGSVPQSTSINFPIAQCLDSGCGTISTCHYQVTGTLINPNEITGTYTSEQNCSTTQSGSFQITLQSRLTLTPPAAPTRTPTP